MAVLQQLAATRDASRLPILLIWSFRHAAELELMCPPLLALARELRLQLTPRLFYTGEPRTAGCCCDTTAVTLAM
jgi:hypothetical protein